MKKLLIILLLTLAGWNAMADKPDPDTSMSQEQKDSLLAVFNELVSQYNDNIYQEPYKALEFAAQARQTAEELGDSLNIAMAYKNLGNGYYTTRIYYLAMEMQFNALEIYSKFDVMDKVAACYVDISRTYLSQEVYDMAEEYCLKAIEICRDSSYPEVRADALATLGKVYIYSNEDEAIPNMMRAKRLYDSLGLKDKSVRINSHIAKAYTTLDEPDSALVLLNNNLDTYTQQSDCKLQDLGVTYVGFAETYENLGDYSKALSYYNKAVDAFTKAKFNHMALVSRMKMSHMQLQHKDLQDAISNAEKVLSQAEQEEVIHGTEEIILKHRACGVLYNANRQLGDNEQALKYCERFAQTGDSVYLLKRQEQFSEFQVSIESQRQQKEIEMIQVNAEKDRLLLAKKGYTRNTVMLIIIIVLVIVLLFFFRNRYKEKAKHNSQLSEANNMMEKEIQDRKMAEIELRNSEEKYRLLFRKTPIGILQFSDKFIITTVNERFNQIFGLMGKNIIGQNINTILPTSLFKNFNSREDDEDGSDNFIRQELDLKTQDGGNVSVAITLKSYYYNTGSEVEKGGIMIVQDITDRKNAERNSDGSNVSARHTLENMPDAVFCLDANANYIYCKVPGLSEKQKNNYIGKNIREMVTSELLLPFLVAFNNVRKTGEIQYVEYQANEDKPDEEPIFNEARFNNCDDDTVLVVVRDITRLKHAERKLKTARNSAEEGSMAKSEFILGMSNEIKEPLENILRVSEQLVMEVTDSQASLKVKDLLNSASYVNETLTDMLKLTEMETGNKGKFAKLINPVNVAQEVFDIFKARAEEKKLEYKIMVDSFVPRKLEIDEVRLRQILFNLLSNGVKYTDKGCVELSITARPTVEHRITMLFTVSDTGVGMSKEMIDEMFNDTSASMESKKGMARSRKMADSMKAGISVRSTEGVGSVFVLSIPDLVTDVDTEAMRHEMELNTNSLTMTPDKIISTTRKRNTDALREYMSMLKYAVIPEYKILKTQMSFEELQAFVNRFREQSVNFHVDKGVEISDELIRNIKNYDITDITINSRKLETFILNLTSELS